MVRRVAAVFSRPAIALRFLQTSQNEIPLVMSRANRDILARTILDRGEFSGAAAPNEFPGLAPGKRVFGSLRLLDVKPPCSNLAGSFGYRPIFFRETAMGSHRGPTALHFVKSVRIAA
jgi:hypothetical protein